MYLYVCVYIYSFRCPTHQNGFLKDKRRTCRKAYRHEKGTTRELACYSTFLQQHGTEYYIK